MLEQMPEILVSRNPEQPAARFEAGGELEICQVGLAIAAAQPILFFCKIVMADAGAVQRAQRLLGGTEIADIAQWLCQMQRYAIDKAAHQRLAPRPQQFRPDIQVPRLCKGTTLAFEQMARRDKGPPRYVIEAPQYGIDLVNPRLIAAKAATLDRGKHVPLQQHALGPSRRQDGGVLFGQFHGLLMPPQRYSGYWQSTDRDPRVRGR